LLTYEHAQGPLPKQQNNDTLRSRQAFMSIDYCTCSQSTSYDPLCTCTSLTFPSDQIMASSAGLNWLD